MPSPDLTDEQLAILREIQRIASDFGIVITLDQAEAYYIGLTNRDGLSDAEITAGLAAVAADLTAPLATDFKAVFEPEEEEEKFSATEQQRQAFDEWWENETGVAPNSLRTTNPGFASAVDDIFDSARKSFNSAGTIFSPDAFQEHLTQYRQSEGVDDPWTPALYDQQVAIREEEEDDRLQEKQRQEREQELVRQREAKRNMRRQRFIDSATALGLLGSDTDPELKEATAGLMEAVIDEVERDEAFGIDVNFETRANLRITEANLSLAQQQERLTLAPSANFLQASLAVHRARLLDKAATGTLTPLEQEQLNWLSTATGNFTPAQQEENLRIRERNVRLLAGLEEGAFDDEVAYHRSRGLSLDEAIAAAREEFGLQPLVDAPEPLVLQGQPDASVFARVYGEEIAAGTPPSIAHEIATQAAFDAASEVTPPPFAGAGGLVLPVGPIGPQTASFFFGEEIDPTAQGFFERLLVQAQDPDTEDDEVAFLADFSRRQEFLRSQFDERLEQAREERNKTIEGSISAAAKAGVNIASGSQIPVAPLPTFEDFLEERLPLERERFIGQRERERVERVQRDRLLRGPGRTRVNL